MQCITKMQTPLPQCMAQPKRRQTLSKWNWVTMMYQCRATADHGEWEEWESEEHHPECALLLTCSPEHCRARCLQQLTLWCPQGSPNNPWRDYHRANIISATELPESSLGSLVQCEEIMVNRYNMQTHSLWIVLSSDREEYLHTTVWLLTQFRATFSDIIYLEKEFQRVWLWNASAEVWLVLPHEQVGVQVGDCVHGAGGLQYGGGVKTHCSSCIKTEEPVK